MQLDVTTHPSDRQPTLQGHSSGRWKGATLVVETAGFAPHAEGIGFGMPSSEGKRLVERFTLDADRRHLNYHVTVEDPRYLTRPVEYSAQWEYSPDLQPSGVACDVDIARRYLQEANPAGQPAGAPPGSGSTSRRTTMLASLAGLLVAVVGLVGRRMRRRVSRSNALRCLPLLVSGSLATVSAAAADATKIELHLLRTTTLSDQQFLTGSLDGAPVMIAGELRLPAAARTQRVPAMVIVHGSGGTGSVVGTLRADGEPDWADRESRHEAAVHVGRFLREARRHGGVRRSHASAIGEVEATLRRVFKLEAR